MVINFKRNRPYCRGEKLTPNQSCLSVDRSSVLPFLFLLSSLGIFYATSSICPKYGYSRELCVFIAFMFSYRGKTYTTDLLRGILFLIFVTMIEIEIELEPIKKLTHQEKHD